MLRFGKVKKTYNTISIQRGGLYECIRRYCACTYGVCGSERSRVPVNFSSLSVRCKNKTRVDTKK